VYEKWTNDEDVDKEQIDTLSTQHASDHNPTRESGAIYTTANNTQMINDNVLQNPQLSEVSSIESIFEAATLLQQLDQHEHSTCM
jgi:hypothetical protein